MKPKKVSANSVFLISSFLVAMLVSVAPLAASSAQTPPVPGCFHFTLNGTQVGPQYCSAKANDIAIIFKPGTNCFFNTGTLAEACPKGANNIEVTWGRAATGAPTLLSCVWTKGGTAVSPCPVQTGSTSFTFYSQSITRVFWTLNGKRIGKPIVSPTPANDVEFSISGVTA
jgi:hypothetical protein